MGEQPTTQIHVPLLVFHCVFRIGMNQFFAVLEDERVERVFIVRITAEEFAFLRRIGVPECTIIDGMAPGAPGMPGIPGMSTS
ncbi:MAG: hypothetical protein AB1700_14080 [Bacillota bacterium]